MKTHYPDIRVGDRAILVGRTGSGKSTLASWILNRSKQHWLIINPKGTKAYSNLPDSNILKTLNILELRRSLDKHQFTLFEPQTREDSSADMMDELIEWTQQNYENIGLCADELYTLHGGNANAKAGLVGWLTRGRELGQSFLGLTQRPRFISQFLFSESEYVGSLDLALENDRKRMVEVTGQHHFSLRLFHRQWLWYDAGKDKTRKFGPVPML